MTRPACYMPWNAVAITANGKLKPCCQWRSNLGDFTENTIDGAFSKDRLIETRKSLLDGVLPKECGSCTEREQMVGTSRRFWFEEKFTVPDPEPKLHDPVKLIQADVNLSNVCNLKCRMCGSWASNQWFEEDRMLAKLNPAYQKDYNDQVIRQTEPHQLEEILSHAKTLQRIDFKGGEPMLAKNHVEFLDQLIACGGENIVLQYTTNGTVVNDKIINSLSRFKKVRIMFSIEGTGDLYQYIRGGQYTIGQMESTLARYNELDNVQIGFNVTIQAYNLLNLAELHAKLIEWENKYTNVSANSAFTTICNSPIYLSPFVLPSELRKIAIEQLHDIDDFTQLVSNLSDNTTYEKHWSTFISFTRDLDNIRGDSIKRVNSVLGEYF